MQDGLAAVSLPSGTSSETVMFLSPFVGDDDSDGRRSGSSSETAEKTRSNPTHWSPTRVFIHSLSSLQTLVVMENSETDNANGGQQDAVVPDTPTLPWDKFHNWLHCICVVNFDLELGQALEVRIPTRGDPIAGIGNGGATSLDLMKLTPPPSPTSRFGSGVEKLLSIHGPQEPYRLIWPSKYCGETTFSASASALPSASQSLPSVPGALKPDKRTKKKRLPSSLDNKPGLYTQYKAFIGKDKVFLKQLVRGLQPSGNRPVSVQSAFLRRHLANLTQSFLQPLEAYMSTLVPKNFAPFKAPPSVSPFNPDNFIAMLEFNGPHLSTGVQGDWAGLYRKFFRSRNFAAWFDEKYSELQQTVDTAHLTALAEADVAGWSKSKGEVEKVDLFLRLRQRLDDVAREKIPVDPETMRQLRLKLEEVYSSLPDDLRPSVKKNQGKGQPKKLHALLLLAFGSAALPEQPTRECPRRVAAISIANRVSEEWGGEVGETVGYKVRFEDCTSSGTKIKYVTDGMLLREAMQDPLLRAYSVLLLDEAHERTLHTDILFGVVKNAQKERLKKGNHLKVVVMSATMDADSFAAFFNNCPIFLVEGRPHTVEIFNSTESSRMEEFKRLSADPGSNSSLPPSSMKVYSLYANLSSTKQQEAFEARSSSPSGSGKFSRKVVLATNIAETSVTIPGIKAVVDCCRAKIKSYNPSTGLESLKVSMISQAQAWQRAGRAGREGDGYCYRLIKEEDFKLLNPQPVPEILRNNLSTVILEILMIGAQDIHSFPLVDKPTPEGINVALMELSLLGAISLSTPMSKQDLKTSQVGSISLTPVGKKMSTFPLDPRFSKVLLKASELGCTEEAIAIISVLSAENVYVNSRQHPEKADEARRMFYSAEGDLITLLKIFRGYKQANDRKWCFQHFLNPRSLQYASDVCEQLKRLCKDNDIPLVSSQDTGLVRKAFAYGLFFCTAEWQPQGHYRTVSGNQAVYVHPSSSMFRGSVGGDSSPVPCVMFTEVVETTKDSREGGSAGLQCQHGQEECEGDKAIQCAQEQKLSDSQLLEFVTCLMQEKNVISRLDECATSSGYDATQLRDCVYSYEGEKLALASRSQIDREYPDMNGVPSWKINGKKDEAVQGSQLGFLQALCRALRNPPVNVCGHEHLLELSLNMMQPYGRQ
ncbi:unnamed protein product [Cyprideis torosa]|uniref:RNA helicase n=1 Tax=Cyprideis torosa TaxID=163714 RepID=A0A7R8W7G1_9CRUS|nr:unnamed protein product [Cyprideis torosa]CAG0886290.1 unnamed protein product [Cyprideis torosa]